MRTDLVCSCLPAPNISCPRSNRGENAPETSRTLLIPLETPQTIQNPQEPSRTLYNPSRSVYNLPEPSRSVLWSPGFWSCSRRREPGEGPAGSRARQAVWPIAKRSRRCSSRRRRRIPHVRWSTLQKPLLNSLNGQSLNPPEPPRTQGLWCWRRTHCSALSGHTAEIRH